MKPTVILDTNALHGRKSLTRTDSSVLLALAMANRIRLVIPDVVVHELSRQWAERLRENTDKLGAALKEINGALEEVGTPGLSLDRPIMKRSIFYDAAVALLRGKHVEIPACPDVPVAQLLERDLDTRKPFTRDGKGFRDALIWEAVRVVCNDLENDVSPVIFVTSNYKDFCVDQTGGLHADLQGEIPADQQLEIVKHLKDVLEHQEIKPLAESLRVVNEAFTRERVEKLVDDALTELQGHDLEPAIGDYDGDGIYTNPIRTRLNDTAFDGLMPDNDTIEIEILHTGDADEMTIRATVEADCSIEGFIDKSDYFSYDSNSFTYYEDWNSHVIRASEPHRVRFTLSAYFTEPTIEDIKLTVDEGEEVTS